jgi:hypothetical protein
MSRKKGSLNKKTLLKLSQAELVKIKPEAEVKPINISSGNIKDLKRQIRELKKLKLQMKSGSKDRINTHRKIK